MRGVIKEEVDLFAATLNCISWFRGFMSKSLITQFKENRSPQSRRYVSLRDSMIQFYRDGVAVEGCRFYMTLRDARIMDMGGGGTKRK